VEKARGNLGGDTREVAERKRKSQRTTSGLSMACCTGDRIVRTVLSSLDGSGLGPLRQTSSVARGRATRPGVHQCLRASRHSYIPAARARCGGARPDGLSWSFAIRGSAHVAARALPRDFPSTWCRRDLYTYATGHAGCTLGKDSPSSPTVLRCGPANRRARNRSWPADFECVVPFQQLCAADRPFPRVLSLARARELSVPTRSAVRKVSVEFRAFAAGRVQEFSRKGIIAELEREIRVPFDVPAAAPSRPLSICIHLSVCLSLPLLQPGTFSFSLPACALPKDTEGASEHRCHYSNVRRYADRSVWYPASKSDAYISACFRCVFGVFSAKLPEVARIVSRSRGLTVRRARKYPAI